ncbi:MAG: DMT family transporter [Alphaproteobacteria bacterium]|nr:DMT family transporter [Alphaproteobacteria bacterium]
MSRLRADLLLLLTAAIWGAAFVAQKSAMQQDSDGFALGPFGFIGARFLLSFLVVLPFALREARNGPPLRRGYILPVLILCLSFCTGTFLQQVGMLTASVTNGGFLTGLYILLVPFFAWPLFGRVPSWHIGPACVLALGGTFLLGGGHLESFHTGDFLILACAVCFGLQVALMGWLVQVTQRPVTLAIVQFVFCILLGLSGGFGWEGLNLEAAKAHILPLLYTGLLAGGLGFTLQAVAQRHTPPADAGIIMASEALFAAGAGAFFLGERLDALGWAGCGLIVLALVLVELGPRLQINILPRAKIRL